jgi:hypothetical protein
MNLSDLKSDFKVLVPEFPFSSYEARVVSWFNAAQRKVGKKRIIDITGSITSEADTSRYALPSSLIDLKRDGVYINGKVATLTTKTLIKTVYGESWRNLDSVDYPGYCYKEGQYLIFVPGFLSAGSTIDLMFWGYANDLAESGDVPFTTGTAGNYDTHDHLRGLDVLLLEYALSMAKLALGFYSSRKDALTNFYAMLEEEVEDLKKQNHLEIQEMQPDPFLLRKFAKRRRVN